MLSCMSGPETKAQWKGVMISSKMGWSLLDKILEIIFYAKLQRLMWQKCDISSGYDILGIKTISVELK